MHTEHLEGVDSHTDAQGQPVARSALQGKHTGGGGDGWEQWREHFLVIGNMGTC